MNDLTYTNSLDEVFINVFRGTDLYQRSARHQLSVHLPAEQGDRRQDPDDHDRQLHRDRRRSVPVLVAWSDPDGDRHDDLGQGRHTIKGGVVFDTRVKTTSTRSTSSRFPAARTTRTAAALFSNGGSTGPASRLPMRHWACSTATPRSASVHSRSGGRWRPICSCRTRGGDREADRRRRRPLASGRRGTRDEQHRELRPVAFYSTSNQAVINPANGRIVSGPRYNGIVLPGTGFPSSASDLAVYNDPAVKRAVRRCAARLCRDAQERVRAAHRHVVRGEREDDRPRRAPACSTTASR